jgi:hypothetical protein
MRLLIITRTWTWMHFFALTFGSLGLCF